MIVTVKISIVVTPSQLACIVERDSREIGDDSQLQEEVFEALAVGLNRMGLESFKEAEGS